MKHLDPFSTHTRCNFFAPNLSSVKNITNQNTSLSSASSFFYPKINTFSQAFQNEVTALYQERNSFNSLLLKAQEEDLTNEESLLFQAKMQNIREKEVKLRKYILELRQTQSSIIKNF